MKSFMITGLAALAAAQAPPPPTEGYTGPGGNATIQSNLPQATYAAVLPATNFNNKTGSTITGSIVGRTSNNGTGVVFTVNLMGFPSADTYGPFIYHVHAAAITNGNCTTAMAHLDPTERGETYSCVKQYPETCQAGDLSGKHGNITTSAYNTSYTELYLSTDPSSPYFFGNKSVVIHAKNTTRLTCANFAMVSANGTISGSNSTVSSNGTVVGGNSTTGGARPSGSGTANAAVSGFSVGSGLVFTAIAGAFFALL